MMISDFGFRISERKKPGAAIISGRNQRAGIGPGSFSIAVATFSGECKERQAMVDPEPPQKTTQSPCSFPGFNHGMKKRN